MSVVHRSKKEPKLTCLDIELATASHFDSRANLIVPNISWGMGLDHEIDLAIVNPKSGYMREVEIKISKSDLVPVKSVKEREKVMKP